MYVGMMVRYFDIRVYVRLYTYANVFSMYVCVVVYVLLYARNIYQYLKMAYLSVVDPLQLLLQYQQHLPNQVEGLLVADLLVHQVYSNTIRNGERCRND